MKKFLCLIGFHKWEYFADGYGRQCEKCLEWQYKLDGLWYHDELGSGYKREEIDE